MFLAISDPLRDAFDASTRGCFGAPGVFHPIKGILSFLEAFLNFLLHFLHYGNALGIFDFFFF